MPDNNTPTFSHIVLDGLASTEPFRAPSGSGRSKHAPMQDRKAHGNKLRSQLSELPVVDHSEDESPEADGLQIEFESFPDIELAFESLAQERSGIELRNVRRDGARTLATVFVPAGKLSRFETILANYLADKQGAGGRSLDHKALVNTIANIREATIAALWTDEGPFPDDMNEAIWWELWLPTRERNGDLVPVFRRIAGEAGFPVSEGELHFPERSVVLARCSPAQLANSVPLLNTIAELRRAKETAAFFDSLPLQEQAEWLADLTSRLEFSPDGPSIPYVCILDTGINRGHPLLEASLDIGDQHTIQPAWGFDDQVGHGTEMAGLSLVGDLTAALVASTTTAVRRRLESVKLLDQKCGNQGDPAHHGYLTLEAVSRPEVSYPSRHRVFVLAITTTDGRDRGRPSAWSAALDMISSDASNDGAGPRLFIVAAGNAYSPEAYPDGNSTDGIHDPGQSWNALTVGAFTEKVVITEPEAEGHTPVAQHGAISPFSTTSFTWDPNWPMKPDVLFEGGNLGRDGLGVSPMASLSVLTSYYRPSERLFTTSHATSAAAALAGGMAAAIMAEYPSFRPETVRALIVHSADWTPEMRRCYLPSDRPPNKTDYRRLVRHCGFGVPNLRRALWSVSNSLALVSEAELQPFERVDTSEPSLKAMHLHALPWPAQELEDLGETEVEMRVTLSYFVEPNPSARGHRSRYRYESHGLRFDVRRPQESVDEFRARVNSAARDEESGTVSSGDDGWLIGKNSRHRGSLHSDVWKGAAADLASRGVLAVYPAIGWWKTRQGLGKWNRFAHYSLIVSIHAPEIQVDLYSAVANQIGVPVVIES